MKNRFFLATLAIMVLLCSAAISIAQGFGTNGQLRILSATPNGMTQTRDQSRAIVVMFNKPMVALQAVPVDQGSGPLVIEPPINGKYRWLGTNTLTFIPADTLPFATGYTAKVPAGTKALDGSTLASDYIWKFETPRPQLIRSRPRNNTEFVKLDSRIFLQFNQPMDPARAKDYMALTKYDLSGPIQLAFELRFPTREELDQFGWDNLMKNVLIVVPKDKFEIESRYMLELKAGLPGAVGNLGTASEASISFSTYNKFAFLNLTARGIRPDQSIGFKFSNPVDMKEFVQHISFQPHVDIPEQYSDGYYGNSTTLYLSLSFLPETTYTVQIGKETKDIFGNSLDSDVVETFSTTSFPPQLYMAGGEGTIEAYGKLRYPIQVRNIDSLRLRLARLSPDEVIPYFLNRAFNVPYNIQRELVPRVKRNVTRYITFKADEPLGGQKYGFVVAEISQPVPAPEYFNPARAFLQVTSLAITAKFSPENNLVWVTRLKDTEPVAGAEVQVRDDQNHILWTGKTDNSGLVETPGWGALGMKPTSWQAPRTWIFVRDSTDWAMTRNEEGTGIDPWRFNIDYDWRPQYRSTSGTVFTDRGLYRAGEQVQIKGIVRQRAADSWIVRKGENVLMTITDPMNEKVYSDSMRLSDYGSFNFAFDMKPDAHLGDYIVRVYARKTGFEYGGYGYYYGGEGQKPPQDMIEISEGSFRVEAFRPAESEVDSRFLQPFYISGDTVSATISARYLFGAPMRNDKVSWKLVAFPGSYTPPGHEGFSFGTGWWDTNRNETLLNSADTNLNRQGMLSVDYRVNVGRLSGTQNLLLEATATSPSRRSVTGRASIILHGGQFYIGIKMSRYFMRTKDTLGFDLLTVRPDGSVYPGRQLKVSIIQRQWISVRKAETDGRYYWESDQLDTTLQTFDVVSSDSALHETFIPKKSGYYIITVSGTDSLGNSIASGDDFYATGSDYVAWARSDDDRIELVADKSSYKPGGVAHVMVKSPYEKARALVTIERDGILSQWSTVLTGSAPEITIPITEKFLPNIFVSVVLLQGRVAAETTKDDVGRPSFKIGYVNLPVDPGTQHLKVAVSTDKEEYHPGDSIRVSISVTDHQNKGAKSEIVISVADMGVLNLINYVLPDPFMTFFGPRALGVVTSETIAHLVEQRSYGEKGEDEGGGGMSLSEVQMRGDFKFTAYWNGSIETDDNGKATVKFKLPDNLSQFKVMAVAQTKESEFGTGSATFRINKELLLQPALPRFARVDDRFDAGTVVTNYSKEKNKVDLLATVDGNVKMTDKGTVEFELEPGESREVRFNYIASSKVGSAKFNYQASMGKYTDGVTLTLPVILPRTRESVALYESTLDTADQALIIPRDVYPDLGEIQLTASSTALGGLENSVDYLIRYPYGCLEQRLSSVYPIILGEKMVKAFNLPVLAGKDMRAVAQGVINEIPKFMTRNGSLAYWKGDQFGYPFLTGYALVVLGKARERGYAVDQDMLNKVMNYSSDFLRKPKGQSYFPWDEECYQATRAIIVYGLALNGHPEPAYMEQLYAQRDKLPLFAKAFLLESVHRFAAGNPGAMAGIESELIREFMNTAKVASTTAHFEEPDWEGLKWVFSSNTRTTAIILQALLETGDRDPFLSKVVRWIMQEQKVGRWRSTQENVFVVAALSDYFEAFESETPDFKTEITIAGKKILDAMFRGREFKTLSETKPLSSFEKDKQLPVHIEKTGPGILYYGLRMNYYPTRDTLIRDEGIAVLKTITTVDGKPVEQMHDGAYVLSAGNMYKVTLSVIVPQERNFVVIDDPLPAGTEPVNLTFETESSFLSASVDNDVSQYEDMYWSGGFNHVEQKDDRVLLFANTLDAGAHTYSYLVRAATYGTFAMPGTHAEEMYTPDVFGGTAFHTVIVK